MSLIPDEEIKPQAHINLAPMVDFLFLVVAVFAVLAITHTALFDTEVSLVKLNSPKEDAAPPAANLPYLINISVTKEGKYKWVAESKQFLMDGVSAIQNELLKQQELGLLPKESSKIKILLHIDKEAQWEPIAQVIFGVREQGFQIHPVYGFKERE